MRRIRWALMLTSAVSVAALTHPLHAAEERISEEARGYFKNGVELLRAENYQDAYYQFRLAYEKSQSWKVLGNLGFCALQLERDGEALGYYEEYLKRGGKEVNAEERASIERDMLLVRGNAGTLELTASRPDVELVDVRAGSRVAGQYYALGEQKQALLLRAGSHTLTATAKDGRVLRWEVVLRPGKTVSHHFDFEAPAEAPAASPPTSAGTVSPAPQAAVSSEATSSGAPLRTVGFIGIGVGAAALGAGVVTGILAKKRETEATDQCDENKVCALGAEEDFDAATSLATVTNVLFIGGGVVAAAGVGLVVFGGNQEGSAPHAFRLELRPDFGHGTAGLTAVGAF